ncbi:unnamed protein product [Cladocopium goreaui]|uniref:tRNA (adenine(58)-N(1))-methyltransferase n=1 Tax=Cladocopium goreaui TaxID=2562237 RepID=A0A9P1FGX6_9DINO|nr:unnamed protein product [Cladocopium goreaui]
MSLTKHPSVGEFLAGCEEHVNPYRPARLALCPMAADAEISDVSTSDTAREGDFVILWGSYTQIFGIVLKHGEIANNRFGNFHHDEIIGRHFGSRVRSRRGGLWLALLRPSPEFITQSLTHRTQIVYHADISLLRALLDARPGHIICEAGTGSGSVSASLSRALRPNGKLYTFEFHEERQKQAMADFSTYGVLDVVVSQHRDVCNHGFGEELKGQVHGVFLDLPAPWAAVPHVTKCLVFGGKVVAFSPCVEQVDKTATELRRSGYFDVRMLETLATNWGVKRQDATKKKRRTEGTTGTTAAQEAEEEEPKDVPKTSGTGEQWLSYQMPMRSHTGYLLVATRAPDGD